MGLAILTALAAPERLPAQFGNETVFSWGNAATNVLTGDFNGDGRWDIGVTGTRTEADRCWHILPGVGNGQFDRSRESHYCWGNGVANAFTGDFDGDGKWDIGVTGTAQDGDRKWYIRYGVGNGQFGRQTEYWWGNGVTNVFTGDFDGDGKWDIGVTGTAEQGDRKWYIRYGFGNGQFGRQTEYWWGNGVTNVFTGDFNGDRLWDIGVTGTQGQNDRCWYVRMNRGNGQFGDEVRYCWGNGATNVFAGDFDGDRRWDIGVTGTQHHRDGNWYIRYNQIRTAAAAPTSAAPAAAGPVRGLYVIDGTGARLEHKNVMWHLYERWDGYGMYWNGVSDVPLASDAEGIYVSVFRQICQDVKPAHQGGRGVSQVFLAGYSRGAMIAVRVANEVRRSCGAHVQFVGLVDAVNTSIGHWPDRLDPGVPIALHIEKPSNHGATVVGTKFIHGVDKLLHPRAGGFMGYGAISHEQMACPVRGGQGDTSTARWNEAKLVEYGQRAGGAFGPALPDSCS